MPRLRCLMIVGSMVTTALLALALPATAATASTGPRVAPSAAARTTTQAAAGTNDYFNSDSCTSSTFCMAIGDYTVGGHTPALSEMLSGGSWVTETVPSPAQGRNVFANEVSCASPTSCLFVGQHWAKRVARGANLAEAWNGSAWRIVTAKGPARATFSSLNDVACPTTKFCLVIGTAGPGRNDQDEAYTWVNGTTWRRIAVPHPKRAQNSELGGLACVSSRSCMAVGDYTNASGHFVSFAASWHDGRWKLLATPAIPKQIFAVFQGISCVTATRCVAVGNTEDNTSGGFFHAFAETWNGHKWRLSTLRRSPSNFIGVSCPAKNRCFASGDTFPSRTAFAHPLMEKWNGRTWTIQHPVETAAPASADSLQHVSCVTQSDCEAVGSSWDPSDTSLEQTLAENWNGQKWTVQTTVSP